MLFPHDGLLFFYLVGKVTIFHSLAVNVCEVDGVCVAIVLLLDVDIVAFGAVVEMVVVVMGAVRKCVCVHRFLL